MTTKRPYRILAMLVVLIIILGISSIVIGLNLRHEPGLEKLASILCYLVGVFAIFVGPTAFLMAYSDTTGKPIRRINLEDFARGAATLIAFLLLTLAAGWLSTAATQHPQPAVLALISIPLFLLLALFLLAPIATPLLKAKS